MPANEAPAARYYDYVIIHDLASIERGSACPDNATGRGKLSHLLKQPAKVRGRPASHADREHHRTRLLRPDLKLGAAFVDHTCEFFGRQSRRGAGSRRQAEVQAGASSP